MDRAAATELQRRGLRAFVRLLGTGAETSRLLERDGVWAAVVPTVPDRSVMNSVAYRDAGALDAALPELPGTYEEAGVRAWTVWVPEHDRDAARLLEAAGHVLDASPAAMVLDLAELPEPEPDGLDWDDRVSAGEVARINDLAYGYPPDTFGRAFTALPDDLGLRVYQARLDGEPASVLGTVDDGSDCGIYLVATVKEARGRGLARRLLHRALQEARERGLRTSTLQATKLGYPVYERLGYRRAFALQMWERRRP